MYIILITISIVYTVSAIVCPANYCETKVCAVVEKKECEVNNDGVFTERGGWCGCCPTCLHKIREIFNSIEL